MQASFIRIIFLFLAALSCSSVAYASESLADTVNIASRRYDVPAARVSADSDAAPAVHLSKKQKFLNHFTWGVDAGASIDLSGEDMSTFTAETYFGYKGSWIRTAALGVGMHKAFGNQYTFVPVYGLLRTSLRSKPSLFFFELKTGYSFNTLANSGSIGGAYGSFGLGINLAMTRKFQSHIVLAYSYFTLRHATELDISYSGDNISSAVLRFGINF